MRILCGALLGMGLASAAPGPPPDDGVRVSVLGYHDFTESEPETEMKIRTAKFRLQMETIRDLNLPVVSMAEFQAWKRGEAELPKQCVVITIDDGWKTVYTEAFPILKEFGYPFTLFLYKNYVDGGGKALTSSMIKEMKQHGATVGSHSVTHPYPATVKKSRSQGPDAYDGFLRVEMGESKRFLESRFGESVTTYAYPGGYHTPEMYPLAGEFGYDHLFTVIPGKVKRSTEDNALPRYVVLGTHDPIFDQAMRFATPSAGSDGLLAAVAASTPYPVTPRPGALVGDRLPLVSVDLSGVDSLDPESLEMTITGFGEVPAKWNEANSQLIWKVNRPLRLPFCKVKVTWTDDQGTPSPEPLQWNFRIDHEVAYLPQD